MAYDPDGRLLIAAHEGDRLWRLDADKSDLEQVSGPRQPELWTLGSSSGVLWSQIDNHRLAVLNGTSWQVVFPGSGRALTTTVGK